MSKKSTARKIVLSILMVAVPTLLSVCFAWLYQRPAADLIRNTVILTGSSLCVVFAWFQGETTHTLLYNNEFHIGRFAMIYLSGVLLAGFFSQLPTAVWPMLPFAVALGLFGNSFLGLFAYSSVLMYTVFLAQTSTNVFLMYFLGGAFAILLFQSLDAHFRVGIPIALSLLFFAVAQMACLILFINEHLSVGMFVFPVLNLFFSGILLFCVLKYFSYAIVHKYRNRYMEINDPEFSLMAEMKEIARKDYFLALHTAYFSERIAAAIGADCALAKAGAYYHRIGKIFKEKYDPQMSETDVVQQICEENEFPPDIREVLRECMEHDYRSKESTIVMFADAVVSMVLYIFSREPDKQPDYSQIVEVIFKKKQENGSLLNSSITIHELNVMQEIFVKEKLYYDFLR